MGFVSILSFTHKLIEERVAAGDTVIDATVGNGVDTLFLAKCVGSNGLVFGFDIQQEALDQAEQRLLGDASVAADVQLFHRSHSEMIEAIPTQWHAQIAAIMFNLGYLPKFNHDIITRPETTLPALHASLRLLRKGGILTIVLYTGHEGGQSEADAVIEWACALPQQNYQVLRYQFMNQQNNPPYLIAVEVR